MFHGLTGSRRTTLLGIGLTVCSLVAGNTIPSHLTARAEGAGFAHVFLIMMENQGDAQIYGNKADAPYTNSLLSKYAYALNYHGVTHPSLPNYLALLSGSFQGVWDDCKAGNEVTCAPQEFMSGEPYYGPLLTKYEIAHATSRPHLFTGQTLVDQLESQHLSWKAYMESAPSVGFTGEYYPVDTVAGKSVPRKLYAEKHNPFMYFTYIANNPARAAKVVPYTQFAQDLSANQVPNFVWISPNQCSDMHGLTKDNAAAVGQPNCAFADSGFSHGPVQVGDAYLKATVGQIMASKAWSEDSAIVIAWDENDYSGYDGCCGSPIGLNGVTLGGGRAPLIVIRSKGAHPVVDATPFNHYSLLATLEDNWGLPCLNEACNVGDTGLMTNLFQ